MIIRTGGGGWEYATRFLPGLPCTAHSPTHLDSRAAVTSDSDITAGSGKAGAARGPQGGDVTSGGDRCCPHGGGVASGSGRHGSATVSGGSPRCDVGRPTDSDGRATRVVVFWNPLAGSSFLGDRFSLLPGRGACADTTILLPFLPPSLTTTPRP
ncbi:hypothetical protein ACOMHN_053643 [Nucella lapillus]